MGPLCVSTPSLSSMAAAATEKKAPAPAITLKDVAADDFIKAYAAFLKKNGKLVLPKWTDYAKTAAYKELSPANPDWMYIRAASIARKVYVRGGLGVGGLKKIYGGPKNNGVRPTHFATSSGAIARHLMKELERLKVVEKDKNGGRKITSTGQRDLDRIAGQVAAKKA